MSSISWGWFREHPLLALFAASFAFSLAISWTVTPAADGYRYLSAARYVADTGNLFGQWPETHMNPKSLTEPRLGIGLTSLAYWIGGEGGARILLALFTALSVYPLSRILSGLCDRRTALVGTSIWILYPINFLWTPFFYIDCIAILFGFFGLWGLTRIVQERTFDAKVTAMSAASFGLSIVVRRASIIYLNLLLLVMLWILFTRRRETRRLISVAGISAFFLLMSTTWTLPYLESGLREVEETEASLSFLVNPEILAGQVIGIFAEFNGFFAGGVLVDWLGRYTLPVLGWGAAAGLLTATFIFGLLDTEKSTRIWIVLSLAAAILQIAFIQYSTGFVAMDTSQARYFAFVSPFIVLVLALGLRRLAARERGYLGEIFYPLAIASISLVMVVGVVNVRMRSYHVGQMTEQVMEASEEIPDTAIASNQPHQLFYELYPRQVYPLQGRDPAYLLERNVTHILMMDESIPSELTEIGFVEVWSETREITGFLGRSRDTLTIEIYRIEG